MLTPHVSSPPDDYQRARLQELSPAMRLLVVCSRLSPSTPLLTTAARCVDDWTAVPRLARHHLIVPLVHRHLASLARGIVPSTVLAELFLARKDSARATFVQDAELRDLVARHLLPRGIPFLALKGLTLASCYYDDVALRQSRDVDLLIAPHRLYELTTELLKAGYRLSNKLSPAIRSTGDLQAYCALTIDVALKSPRGVRFELHRRIDRSGSIYPKDHAELFAASKPTTLSDGTLCWSMNTTNQFLYLCYHHGRHRWSRLHWIADLDAMLRHPSFDLPTIRARARKLGMTRLVEAALALYTSLGGEVLVEQTRNSRPLPVVATCLHHLGEGVAPPESARAKQERSVRGLFEARCRTLQFDWDASTRWRSRCHLLWGLTSGTFADYSFVPLPRALFGAYRLTRPIRHARDILLLSARSIARRIL